MAAEGQSDGSGSGRIRSGDADHVFGAAKRERAAVQRDQAVAAPSGQLLVYAFAAHAEQRDVRGARVVRQPPAGLGTRRARRAGRLPVVVYGDGKAPEHLSVNTRDFTLALERGARVIDLQSGEGEPGRVSWRRALPSRETRRKVECPRAGIVVSESSGELSDW